MRTWILAGLAALLFIAVVVENVAKADDTSVEAALSTILKNQEKILDSLAEIKEELEIVKVRATQK
jgi:hypothetical protein